MSCRSASCLALAKTLPLPSPHAASTDHAVSCYLSTAIEEVTCNGIVHVLNHLLPSLAIMQGAELSGIMKQDPNELRKCVSGASLYSWEQISYTRLLKACRHDDELVHAWRMDHTCILAAAHSELMF